MMRKLVLPALLLVFVMVLSRCGEKPSPSPEDQHLSAGALQGKTVFVAKKCGDCHILGDTTKVPKMPAPDLSSPFLANDSLFVRAHLKVLEETRMPPVELMPEEIRLVSLYIAELHAARHATVADADADARCPVCNAPVASTQAEERGLRLEYLGKVYYFECPKCKNLFIDAPEAYRHSG